MKVIGYARDLIGNDSIIKMDIEEQESKIRTYCSIYDLELVGIIKDPESGKNIERKWLRRAFQMLNNGNAEGLVISSPSCLSCNIKDFASMMRDYFEKKYKLMIISPQIDTRTPTGEFIATILVAMDQWKVETDMENKLNYEPDKTKILAMVKYIVELAQKGFSNKEIYDALERDGLINM